jgi:hypothetical protein
MPLFQVATWPYASDMALTIVGFAFNQLSAHTMPAASPYWTRDFHDLSIPSPLSCLFALGLGRLARSLLLSEQQLSQDLQIAAQNAQANITPVTLVAAVAATL